MQTLAQLTFVVGAVWFAGALLLRLVAISCFICAAGLLALGSESPGSALRAATYGAGCWLISELLHRARHGRWRTRSGARLLSPHRWDSVLRRRQR